MAQIGPFSLSITPSSTDPSIQITISAASVTVWQTTSPLTPSSNKQDFNVVQGNNTLTGSILAQFSDDGKSGNLFTADKAWQWNWNGQEGQFSGFLAKWPSS